MNKKYLLGLLAIIPFILWVNEIEANQSNVFQIYDDGVTHYYDDNGWSTDDFGIILNDTKISCALQRASTSLINPVCIEIILRSIP